MIRRPPRSTLFPYTNALPICRLVAGAGFRVLEMRNSPLTAEGLAGSGAEPGEPPGWLPGDRKSTRLNSSHSQISYAVFCLKKKKLRKVGCEAGEGGSCRWKRV